ncbi:MAG: RES family NAD+ phosphorylase [Burkholderiales bacterium]|nr:RES family NAD+ phosphorylase [Burkholderiales bacterium]
MFGPICSATVFVEGDLVRNIKTIRASQDLFDDLSTDPVDWNIAIASEAAGYRPTTAPIITRPFDYGTVVTYAFDPSHWQATRFGDGRHHGVWYGSIELETTVYETVFHWHRFIVDSYPDEDRDIVGERRVFDVRCDALLIDLQGREAAYPDLVSRTSYGFTQSLGRFLFDQDANGVLTRSARCDGINAVVLRPARLSNVRDKLLLTYRCNPTKDRCRVERTPGRTWMTITPSTLG